VSFYYSVSGLSIRSNSFIPNLEPADSFNAVPDLEIFIGFGPRQLDGTDPTSARLAYVSDITDAAGQPAVKFWELHAGMFLHIAYSDGTSFWFDRAGTTLWATFPGTSSLESTALYLLGPVFALLLRYRGMVCLHASAVAQKGRAVAFVGPEEAGKSTTAAALAQRGFAVLSDDVVPLQERDGTFFALPGSPHLRLWPESVEMLFGHQSSLPHLLPDWEKRRLSAGDHNSDFCEQPSELGTIYVLNRRSQDAPAPCIGPLDQQTALMALVANSYTSRLIDLRMRAEELTLLGRLVSRIPVRQLTPHADAARLNDLCDLICEDLQIPRHVKAAGRH
jgi:hypothetical protein